MKSLIISKETFLVLGALFLGLFFANYTSAFCPVCVVAVGAGLGLSRWLGVDDVVSSIWIGGLLVAVSVWTVIWIKGKKFDFKYSQIIVPVLYYLLVLVPLYFTEIIGHPLNKFLGTDKIIFGATVGSVVFLSAIWLHNFLKIKNRGKSYFSYQKVVLPVVVLILTSLIFYAILKWWML